MNLPLRLPLRLWAPPILEKDLSSIGTFVIESNNLTLIVDELGILGIVTEITPTTTISELISQLNIPAFSVNRGVSIDVARKIDLASFYTKMKS